MFTVKIDINKVRDIFIANIFFMHQLDLFSIW